MNIEIERKFIVKPDKWKPNVEGVFYRQNYLSITDQSVVRVRIKGTEATLTVKASGTGLTREEYQYEISVKDAENLLHLCPHKSIEKTRYKIDDQGHRWDVDEFRGKNEGLLMAEVELKSETEEVILPEWIEVEVTGDPRYYNAALIQNSFQSWGNKKE